MYYKPHISKQNK